MDFQPLIGIIGTILGMVFGYVAFARANRTEAQKEAEQMTTVIVKLENIGNGISEIKTKLDNLEARVSSNTERIVVVEQSVKSAHKRIDDLMNEKI